GFKRNKREWKAIPHEKSIHEFEQKIMKLTKRNWSVSLEERIEKINQVIRGWSNYFRCAWLYKETVRKLDSKLRRRIRAIIWKQWKSIRKKEESLVRLGCPRDKAHSYACARQGYVRCATTFLNKYIRNIHLKKKGLLSMEEYFDTVAERFMKTFVRTAQCRTACWVV
ncbi:group II intron maturase-specific domain-containing protein, partial [Faecalibaculum rodentium]